MRYSFLLLLLIFVSCKKDHPVKEPDGPKLTVTPAQEVANSVIQISSATDFLDTNKTVVVKLDTLKLSFKVVDLHTIMLKTFRLPAKEYKITVENNGKIYGPASFTIISRALWTPKKDLAARRYGAVTFTVGDKGYLGLGSYMTMYLVHNARFDFYQGFYNPDDPYMEGDNSKDFLEYDPVTDKWTKLADFPGGKRFAAVSFSTGNKGYAGFGNNQLDFFNDLWEYDPAAKTWTRMPDCPGGARANAVCFNIENKGYVLLGSKRNSKIGVPEDYRDMWEFDPAVKKWSKMADFPGAAITGGSSAFSIGLSGYVCTPNGELWQYTPGSNSWKQKTSYPVGSRTIRGATTFSIKDKGYMGMGGFHDQTFDMTKPGWGATPIYMSQSDIWEYDPVTDKWLQMDLAYDAELAFSMVVANKAYIGGGTYYLYGTQTRNPLYWTLYEFSRR